MTTTMPTINLDSVDMTIAERAIAEQILKPDGSLFASKPTKASGDAKYLWRMVAFGISPHGRHQCIPVTADFDLDGDFDARRLRAKELDDLSDRIEKAVSVFERYGTLRWGRALGMF